MRASDFYERRHRLDVLQYAPPQYRVPAGEATIRPILERLSRGISQDDLNSACALSVPPAEPIHAHDASPSSKISLSVIERLAVAMGVAAVLATVSVTFLQSKAEHPASAASADPSKTAATSDIADEPKKVHTVKFGPATTMAAEAQSSTVAKEPPPPSAQSGASVADRIEAVGMTPALPRPEAASALAAPLTIWAMFPAAPASGPWSASSEPPDVNDVKDAPQRTTSVPHRKAKATKHVRRDSGHRTRPQQAQSAAAKPQLAKQAAAPAETQANAVQPIKKFPLQAALDAIFGHHGAGNAGASGGAAPSTSEAAFR
jgi:hypothetical protein